MAETISILFVVFIIGLFIGIVLARPSSTDETIRALREQIRELEHKLAMLEGHVVYQQPEEGTDGFLS